MQTHKNKQRLKDTCDLVEDFNKKQSFSVCRCYVTRTSLQCVSPGMSYGQVDSGADANGPTWAPNDDTRVCFQYSGIDSLAKKLNDKDLYNQLDKDLKEYGAQEVKVGAAVQVPACSSRDSACLTALDPQWQGRLCLHLT